MLHPINPASNRDIQLTYLSTVSPQETDRQSGEVNLFGRSTSGNPPAYSALNISEPT
ncbi:hypothetical protein SERLA73DRAFT_130913 [Serpula lacrymans var. lacrymans S7.3]|uniref:Uncharacterized protein n=2 Tax=Serpula lacrymans var. lacrymans TaxID=341189 RepID=F8PLW1_SERL3|nr:uncharacterized protein SERLADRAFT_379946 [Serpula lacrymans var. lacrymans S7.9]EGO02593.1 hypothetical protein SERLA73DRAFT_130913 [Serpula lacrymans var. lacrymans S7.3]EGO28309.1 hypothetical protein SERLADRAFT_379946 [Serpula lacrymans var. lacrymans S7.9]